MTIEFRCGQCNQLLRVPDNSAGKNARCPKCQALMQVPAATPAAAPFGASAGPAPPPPLPGQFATNSPSSPPTFTPPPPPPPKSDDPFAFLNADSATASAKSPAPPVSFGDTSAGGGPIGVNPYTATPTPQGYGSGYGAAYGQPVTNPMPMVLAAGSLVTAFAGLLSCGCCLFLPFPPISLLLGVVALCTKPDKNAKIVAIIGIVLSVISIILFIVGLVLGLASASLDPQFQQDFGN